MGEYRTIKDLRNKAVVSVTTGQKIATAVDALLDPASLRVAAVTISGGTMFRPERQLILADAVQLWGQDVILVRSNDVIVGDLDMEPDTGWLLASDYLRQRAVVGSDGRRLGRVDDILLDEQGRFVGYQLGEVAVQGPLAQSRFIPAASTQSLGKDVLLVDSSRLNGDSAHPQEAAAGDMDPVQVGWSSEPQADEPSARQVPTRITGRETIELVEPDQTLDAPDEMQADIRTRRDDLTGGEDV